jgi:hypothetical protein
MKQTDISTSMLYLYAFEGVAILLLVLINVLKEGWTMIDVFYGIGASLLLASSLVEAAKSYPHPQTWREFYGRSKRTIRTDK